jgi:hypothetical protein
MTVKCHVVLEDGSSALLGNPFTFASVPRIGERIALQVGLATMKYRIADVMNVAQDVDSEASVVIIARDSDT